MIRNCFRNAQRAIFTVPLETIAWLPRNRSRAVYIPIGANIPERVLPRDSSELNPSTPKTVAVFCLSLGENRLTEIADLAHAAERVRDSVGAVRFVVLGKGSAEAREEIEQALAAKRVEVCVIGRLPAEQVANTLAAADVLLYLGAYVTQTRGSALAGVACGLPIVGYAAAVREPICDAGVVLVPHRDRHALAAALVRVLKDDGLRSELRRRSCEAQLRHFSWNVIAARFVRAFDPKQAST
ncbi:MAG: glycosyltransferase [Candidatus Acidiferrales bacterium]